jgi:hypothetical protein
MGNRYLDSAGGNTPPYESVTDAATQLSTFNNTLDIPAGEIIWVDSTNVDASYVASINFIPSDLATFKAPQQVICVSDLSDPTTLAEGAIIGATGVYSITLQANWYFKGVTFKPGYSGTPGATSTTYCGNSGAHLNQVYENCKFLTGYTGTSTCSVVTLGVGSTIGERLRFKNIEVGINQPLHRVVIMMGDIEVNGMTIAAGSASTCTALLYVNVYHATAIIRNFDFSNFTSLGLLSASASRSGFVKLINGKIPASTTVLYSAIAYPGFRLYLINVDDGSDNKRYEIYDYAGVIYLDSGVYATTTPSLFRHDNAPVSLRLATNANASYFCPLVTEWVEKSGEAGVAVTINIEALVGADGAAALDTRELWLDVEYLGSSASPLGTSVTTQAGIIAAAGTAVAAGTTAWTGDPYTTERTHKLTATFTPQMDGNYRYRVSLAKASTTIYLKMV